MALPVTASFWVDGALYLRISGSQNGLREARRRLGGDADPDPALWPDVRDHRHGFFRDLQYPLYRVVTPPAAPLPQLDERSSLAVEWSGGLRWISCEDEEFVSSYSRSVGGWYWRLGQTLQISRQQLDLMARIKRAFDPDGVFQSPLELPHAD